MIDEGEMSDVEDYCKKRETDENEPTGHPVIIAILEKEIQSLTHQVEELKEQIIEQAHSEADLSEHFFEVRDRMDGILSRSSGYLEKSEKLQEQVARMGSAIKKFVDVDDEEKYQDAVLELEISTSEYSPDWLEGKIEEAEKPLREQVARMGEALKNLVDAFWKPDEAEGEEATKKEYIDALEDHLDKINVAKNALSTYSPDWMEWKLREERLRVLEIAYTVFLTENESNFVNHMTREIAEATRLSEEEK